MRRNLLDGAAITAAVIRGEPERGIRLNWDEKSFNEYVRRCWDAFDMDRLYEAYRQSVLVSYAIADQIAQRERVRIRNAKLDDWGNYTQETAFEDKFTPETPYPRCYLTEHTVKGQTVYQLSYDGMLPLYFETDPRAKTSLRSFDRERLLELSRYHSAVRDHYLRATLDTVTLWPKRIKPFSRAFLYICHFFGNQVIRDLDNRNRGLLINAARLGGLISGDEWERLEVMESGFLDIDQKNHVSVFISDQEIGLSVVDYVKRLYRNGHRFRVEKVPVNG